MLCFFVLNFLTSQADCFQVSGKFSLLINSVVLRQSDFFAKLIVIFTIHHRRMDDSGTLFCRDKVRGINLIRLFAFQSRDIE